MSEMIERVAKAIDEAVANWQPGSPQRIKEMAARAAIEAMREPSAAMLRAATAAEHDHFWPGKHPTSHTWKSLPAMLVKKLWSAMIDAALQRSP